MLEFQVLGPLLVRSEGEEVPIPGARRRALLIRLLVSANQSVPAELLIDDVWETDPPAGAGQTLQSHLSYLRKVLGKDRILRKAAGYVLISDDLELDATVFEIEHSRGMRAHAAGDPHAAARELGTCLARWKGSPLVDVNTAAWALPEIARLGEMKVVALEAWIDSLLSLGRHLEAVKVADAAVADYAFSERFWAQLMLSLYRSGRQAEALRAFQRLRAHLGQELGIEPSSELITLEEAIVLQKPELDWAEPDGDARRSLFDNRSMATTDRDTELDGSEFTGGSHTNIRERISSFVGRSRALADIRSELGRSRLLSLVGPGGCGKTRLALEVAADAVDERHDGAWLAELAPLSDGNAVASEIVKIFRIDDKQDRPVADRLIAGLRNRELLLVLDNCEQVIAPVAELVATILATCPGLIVLATSREPLGIAGETVYRVPPMSTPHSDGLSPDEIAAFEAVELFVERTAARRSSFELDVHNARAVGAIFGTSTESRWPSNWPRPG